MLQESLGIDSFAQKLILGILKQRHNRKYLGRRFVVIEEVFEEQYKLAKGDIDPSPMDVDPSPSITKPSVSTSSFSSKPLSMSSGAAQVEVCMC